MRFCFKNYMSKFQTIQTLIDRHDFIRDIINILKLTCYSRVTFYR